MGYTIEIIFQLIGAEGRSYPDVHPWHVHVRSEFFRYGCWTGRVYGGRISLPDDRPFNGTQQWATHKKEILPMGHTMGYLF